MRSIIYILGWILLVLAVLMLLPIATSAIYEETEGIPALEACACGQRLLVRNIPVFSGWLEDGVNAYMADSVDGFRDKLCGILEGELPDLTAAAMSVAQSREIHKVGRELIEVYRSVLGNNAGVCRSFPQ